MIIFKEIYFENFLSFYGKHSYTFDNNGIHWITGENLDAEEENVSIGSGKSAFTFVIQYALFGLIEKKLSKKDKTINKQAKKNLTVQLIFECDKELYRVSRYRKHSEFDNGLTLEVFVDEKWNDISKPNVDDTQKEIDKIISITPDTFLKIILYSREDDKHFFKLTNSERIKIFENIIQLNKFNKYLKRIKDKLKKANEKFIGIEKEESASIKAIKIHTDNEQEETNFIKSEEKRIKKELKKLKEQNLDIDINAFLLLKGYLNVLNNKLKEEQKETIVVFDSSSLKKQYEKLQERVERQIKRINDFLPVVCDNCGSIQNEVDYNNELNLMKATLDDLITEMNEKEEEVRLMEEVIPEQKKKKEEKKLIINKIKKEIDEIEIKIDKDFSEINEMDEDEINEIQNNNDLIEELEKEFKKLSFDKANSHKEKATEEKEKLKAIILEKQIISNNINMLKWWEQALDVRNDNSIKSYVMLKVIPVFNRILMENLNQVFNGKLNIIVDNLLNEKIIKDGEEYDYFELSSGEKFKVNFCTNFSIFDMTKINLNASNLMFFDDVFINIDNPTTEKFLNIIKDKYSKQSAIYLISHDKNVENNINPKTKTVIKKRDKCSSIEIV